MSDFTHRESLAIESDLDPDCIVPDFQDFSEHDYVSEVTHAPLSYFAFLMLVRMEKAVFDFLPDDEKSNYLDSDHFALSRFSENELHFAVRMKSLERELKDFLQV